MKPSFVDKEMEKGIVCELSTQEIQEIMDKAVPETTKKSHKVRNEINGTYPLSFNSHHFQVVS